MRNRLIIVVILGVLMGCAAPVTDGPVARTETYLRLEQQISQIQSDPAIAAFLAEEAVKARVTDIVVVQSDGFMRKRHGKNEYELGSATFHARTRSTAIKINRLREDATSVTNIAHEIAHAGAFRTLCLGHGKRWASYFAGIAERFETRFPGRKWGSITPSRMVETQVARYPDGHC